MPYKTLLKITIKYSYSWNIQYFFRNASKQHRPPCTDSPGISYACTFYILFGLLLSASSTNANALLEIESRPELSIIRDAYPQPSKPTKTNAIRDLNSFKSNLNYRLELLNNRQRLHEIDPLHNAQVISNHKDWFLHAMLGELRPPDYK